VLLRLSNLELEPQFFGKIERNQNHSFRHLSGWFWSGAAAVCYVRMEH